MPKKKSTLIIDLGSGSIKAGFNSTKEPEIIDNCIFKAKNVSNKTYIGSELNDCNNLSGLYFYMPFKKGYINNWELQKQILDKLMQKMFDKNEDIKDTNFIITEPVFNFTSTRETMQEIFFEEYHCNGLVLSTAAFLSDFKHRRQHCNEWSLVIDSGYSNTTIIPFHNGVPLYNCVKRISIGGKILTNRLVEVISYGQLDVRSEVFIMNQCKEDVCYVSNNFWNDLNKAKCKEKSKNDIRMKYVLPDYVTNRRGFIVDQSTNTNNPDQYSIQINNERFCIPEILFHPSDVGYHEMGVAEGSAYILNELLPENAKVGCYGNILLTGGNACFPGYKDRIFTDLRSTAPDDFPVQVFQDKDPRLSGWMGGYHLSNDSQAMDRYLITKKEYSENGIKYCEDKYPI